MFPSLKTEKSAKVSVFAHAYKCLHLPFPIVTSVSLPPSFPPCHTFPPKEQTQTRRGQQGIPSMLSYARWRWKVRCQMSDILSPAKVNTKLLLTFKDFKYILCVAFLNLLNCTSLIMCTSMKCWCLCSLFFILLVCMDSSFKVPFISCGEPVRQQSSAGAPARIPARSKRKHKQRVSNTVDMSCT